MRRWGGLLVAGSILLSSAAQGQDRHWPDEVAAFGLAAVPARVKPGVARTHFHRDGAGCPRPADACRAPSFVAAGDEVVVAIPDGDAPFVRAIYRARPDEPMVSGWLATKDLIVDASAPPVRPAAVVGAWAARVRPHDNDAGIVLRNRGGGVLHLTAESRIVDAQGREVAGAPQRDLEGVVGLSSDPYITLRRGECVLRLIPAGRYLVVIDEEGRCADGGDTLALSGLYLRDGPSR